MGKWHCLKICTYLRCVHTGIACLTCTYWFLCKLCVAVKALRITSRGQVWWQFQIKLPQLLNDSFESLFTGLFILFGCFVLRFILLGWLLNYGHIACKSGWCILLSSSWGLMLLRHSRGNYWCEDWHLLYLQIPLRSVPTISNFHNSWSLFMQLTTSKDIWKSEIRQMLLNFTIIIRVRSLSDPRPMAPPRYCLKTEYYVLSKCHHESKRFGRYFFVDYKLTSTLTRRLHPVS